MYIGIGALILISLVVYELIKYSWDKAKEREDDKKLTSFARHYGKAPDDPDALNAYYEAMEKEVDK